MKTKLLMWAFMQVIENLDPQTVKEVIDDALDQVESRTDNVAVRESIGLLRKVMDIPDDIGGDDD